MHLQVMLSSFMLFVLLVPILSSKLNAVPPPPHDLDSPTIRQGNPPCAANCRFRICNNSGNGTSFVLIPSAFVILNQFNTASLPHICLPSEPNIGFIPSFGQAQVNLPAGLRNISQWSPAGLSRPFPTNMIRLQPIVDLPWSGVSTIRPRGNQWSFLNRRCMSLPINSYLVLNPVTNRRIRRVNLPGNDPDDCVAFRTLAPLLQIQARWNSRDDFDIEIIEPDGTLIDWVTPRSRSGRLNGDNNVNECGSALTRGRENVLYDFNTNIQSGTYIVRLNHFNQCSTRTTNWQVSVVMNGIVSRSFSGTSNNSTGIAAAFGRTVLDETFVYP